MSSTKRSSSKIDIKEVPINTKRKRLNYVQSLELLSLPEELLLEILLFLKFSDLIRLSETCTIFKRLSDDKRLWNKKSVMGKEEFVERYKVMKFSERNTIIKNVNYDFLTFEYISMQEVGITERPRLLEMPTQIIEDTSLFEPFLRLHRDKLDWTEVCSLSKLPEGLLRDFFDKLPVDCISKYQTLTEHFMTDFFRSLDCYSLCQYQTLSENFIRTHLNSLHLYPLCRYQKLSESLLRDIENLVPWPVVCRYQKLSEKFLDEFSNRLDWDKVIRYQHLSKDFIIKHQQKINWRVMLHFQPHISSLPLTQTFPSLKEQAMFDSNQVKFSIILGELH